VCRRIVGIVSFKIGFYFYCGCFTMISEIQNIGKISHTFHGKFKNIKWKFSLKKPPLHGVLFVTDEQIISSSKLC
jgi:hypothetical protein